MTTPTIVTVIPTQVSTLGSQLFQILGFNFREPPEPESGVIPVPTPNPTVEVEVDGVTATRVDVINEGRLVVYMSPLGEGDHDITVRNLDDDGDPIPGEEDTKSEGIRYLRPDLTEEQGLTALSRALLQELKKQVHPNVVLTEHVDYDESPFGLAHVAELPAIVLIGPTLVHNTLSDFSGYEIVNESDDEFDMRRRSRRADVVFEVMGLSDRKIELTNLQHLVQRFFHLNQVINVGVSPDFPEEASGIELEMDFESGGDMSSVGEPNESNIRQFTGSAVIREFEVGGAIFAKGAVVTEDVVLDTLSVVGEILIHPITGEELGPCSPLDVWGIPINSPGP